MNGLFIAPGVGLADLVVRELDHIERLERDTQVLRAHLITIHTEVRATLAAAAARTYKEAA